MEREASMENSREKIISYEGASGGEGGPGETAARRGPTWRALAVSIVVAVALSIAATLLLGGIYRIPGGNAGGQHAIGNDCCPPPEHYSERK